MRMIITLVAGLAFLAVSGAKLSATTSDSCGLTLADKVKNRMLDWVSFDQGGASPTSWRSLEERGCHLAAADAAADYLAHGPMPDNERWQSTTRFHMGQSLASAGRHDEAAKVVATARRITPVGNMDWNSYVSGTYAFLIGDKSQLVLAQKRLASSLSSADYNNNGVLLGLTHCFRKPYKTAYSLKCRVDGGWVVPVAKQSSPLIPALKN